MGRKKIDKQIIDEKGSFLGEKLYGEDAGYSFRDGSFGGAMMGGAAGDYGDIAQENRWHCWERVTEVETVFGQIKHNQRFRRFLLRE